VSGVPLWCGPEPDVGNYFVSTYPPFSCWRPDATAALREALARLPPGPAGPAFGLYVHVPFCVERCAYCYYLTYDNRSGDIGGYLNALVAELGAYRATPMFADRHLGFVYVGGGTPSVLPLPGLRGLVGLLQQAAPWTHTSEVTFECAPKSVTEDKMHVLRDAGVTRLSLGVQEMDDAVLAANGRVHLVRDVERAWNMIRRAGFPVVNIDLIVGLVHETDDTFFQSLQRVIGLGPESVTIYQLEIPPNTRLYRDLRAGHVSERPADWATKHARLEAGWSHLERAGYRVRTGYAAVRDPERHAFVYQDQQYRGADVLGIGVSAFSYLDGINQQNLASMDAYLAACRRGDLPLWRGYVLTEDERMVREFVLQLKLGSVEREYFRHKFGVNVLDRFREPLDDGRRYGWLEVHDAGVRVTRPGLLRVDRLLPAFYRQEHQNIRDS
jgi:oxygen-independent coproporphyrinogen-3 oxidase